MGEDVTIYSSLLKDIKELNANNDNTPTQQHDTPHPEDNNTVQNNDPTNHHRQHNENKDNNDNWVKVQHKQRLSTTQPPNTKPQSKTTNPPTNIFTNTHTNQKHNTPEPNESQPEPEEDRLIHIDIEICH